MVSSLIRFFLPIDSMEALNASLNAMFGNMPPTVRTVWSVFALLMVVAVLVAALYERRRYAAHNKAGAWLFVRISTLPIAAASAAAVWFPARAVGGPEALAAFYLLAFTAGPLVYFGLHWFAGRVAGLARREALGIGLSGLFMLLVPVALANQVNSWVFDLARVIDGTAPGSNSAAGEKRPPLHQVVEQQRFTLPGIGEVWTERWQAPAGVRVERVEREVRGQYVEMSSNYLCRNGEDVHVFWHGAVAPAHWRVHWRDANDRRAYSDCVMTPPAAAAIAFTPEWLPDGFALPVPVPGDMIFYTWMRENGREDSRRALEQGPVASTSSACVQTLRRPVSIDQPQITGMGLRLWRVDTQQMLHAVFRRSDTAVTPSAGTRQETGS
jgi:hypothetical protein